MNGPGARSANGDKICEGRNVHDSSSLTRASETNDNESPKTSLTLLRFEGRRAGTSRLRGKNIASLISCIHWQAWFVLAIENVEEEGELTQWVVLELIRG